MQSELQKGSINSMTGTLNNITHHRWNFYICQWF